MELIDKNISIYAIVVNREKKIGCFRELLCVLIYNYELAHQDSKFLVKRFSTFNIAYISKFVVKFNLIMMSNPNTLLF